MFCHIGMISLFPRIAVFLYAVFDNLVLSCLNWLNNFDLAKITFHKFLLANEAWLHLAMVDACQIHIER